MKKTMCLLSLVTAILFVTSSVSKADVGANLLYHYPDPTPYGFQGMTPWQVEYQSNGDYSFTFYDPGYLPANAGFLIWLELKDEGSTSDHFLNMAASMFNSARRRHAQVNFQFTSTNRSTVSGYYYSFVVTTAAADNFHLEITPYLAY